MAETTTAKAPFARVPIGVDPERDALVEACGVARTSWLVSHRQGEAGKAYHHMLDEAIVDHVLCVLREQGRLNG